MRSRNCPYQQLYREVLVEPIEKSTEHPAPARSRWSEQRTGRVVSPRCIRALGLSSQGSFEQMKVEEVVVRVVDWGEGSCRLRPGKQEGHAEGKGDECDVGDEPELQG